jgi:hypothetical protein
MQLTDKDLESFQALYKKHFNKDISRAEALAKGTQLLILMKAVYKPMTQEQYDFTQARRKSTMGKVVEKILRDMEQEKDGASKPNVSKEN